MLRQIIVFILLSFSALCVAGSNTNSIVDIKEWHTDNGARVLYVYAPELPMVDINLVFAAGSAYDGNNYGIAALTSAMMDEGTVNMNTDAIAETFENVGAIFGSGAGRDQASLSLRSLTQAQYLTPALKAFSEVIAHPTFPQKNLTRVKTETQTAIKERMQNPSAIASETFSQLVYGSYPYAHPVIGDSKTVDAITKNQIKQFYKQYYVGNNALIVIVGDVKREQAEQIANQIIAELPAGSKATALEPASINAGPIDKHIQYPATQTYIRIGNLATKYNNPINYALSVGNYILGGGPLVSKLFSEVREKRGLSYNVRSGFNLQQENGTFAISLQARSDHAAEAITVSRDVLQNFIKNGPTTTEVEKAKQSVIDSFINRLQGNGRILSAVSMIGFYNLPLDYLDTYRKKVKQVTLDDINQAFRKTINPEQLITVTVGPEADKQTQDELQMSENALISVTW